MGIISKMRRQTAVYWSFSGVDEFGKKTYDSPVEIKCRWDGRIEEFLDSGGERQLSQAVVYVDRETPIGGVLMLGVLGDITDAVKIKENEGAWEIRRYDTTPNLKATEWLRTVYL